ncbi:MAG: hypothetical protein HQ567_09010 [Candidatus Nealsonbacteria bacterium]|nr:hypothetical protein [Candidatus Nealsonbacteria bacterium]
MAEQSESSASVVQAKDQLELEKLELELEQLRHPVKSSLKSFGWKDIVTIFVAFAAIMVGVMTGLFNVRNERLRIERMQLEDGNKELEETRTSLQNEQGRIEEELRITRDQLGLHDKEWETIGDCINTCPDDDIDTGVILIPNVDGSSFSIGVELVGVDWPSSLYLEDGTLRVEYIHKQGEPQVKVGTSEILDKLQHIRRLSSLTIKDIQLAKEDVERIARLKIDSLSLINISDGECDDLVDPIGEMTNLTALGLGGNKGIRHPRALGRLNRLTFLNLAKTSFDDEGMALLRASKDSLRSLILGYTQVSDGGLRHLKGFTRLESLELNSCKQLTGTGLIELADLPKLDWLNLSGADAIDEDSRHVESLMKRNPSLRIQTPR